MLQIFLRKLVANSSARSPSDVEVGSGFDLFWLVRLVISWYNFLLCLWLHLSGYVSVSFFCILSL